MARRQKNIEPDTIASYFTTQFSVDVRSLYDKLKNIAVVSDVRDRNTLLRYINEAAKNAVDARIVATHAKKIYEYNKIDELAKMRDLRMLAMRRIRDDLDLNGIARKQITKDMIEEEIASGNDTRVEYRALIERREELLANKTILDEFAKQWSDRKQTLQSQLRAVTAEREVVLGYKEKE